MASVRKRFGLRLLEEQHNILEKTRQCTAQEKNILRSVCESIIAPLNDINYLLSPSKSGYASSEPQRARCYKTEDGRALTAPSV